MKEKNFIRVGRSISEVEIDYRRTEQNRDKNETARSYQEAFKKLFERTGIKMVR